MGNKLIKKKLLVILIYFMKTNTSQIQGTTFEQNDIDIHCRFSHLYITLSMQAM